MSSNQLVYFISVLLFICLRNCIAVRPREPYFGESIGQFETEDVKGNVYAVEKEVIFIKDFSYKDTENDTYFAITQDGTFENVEYILNTEICGTVQCPLKHVESKDVLIRLPPGNNLENIKALMIAGLSEDIASIHIPEKLFIQKHRKLGEFSRKAHRLQSGNIIILDARTFLIPDLYYDGKGPDAYFWVGNGTVNEKGMRIPDENGLVKPLKEYKGETIIIQLPSYLTVYEIEYLAMWCVQFKHNFGEVFLPKDLTVPPALGQNTAKLVTKTSKPKTEDKIVIKEIFRNCTNGTTCFQSNVLYFIIILIVSRYM